MWFSCVSCRHVSFEGNCLSNVTRAGELRQHSAFECHLSYFSLSSESPQKRRVSSHGSLQVRRFKKKVVYAHLLETRHLNRVGRKSLSCSTAKELIGYSIWAGAHHTQYGRPSVSSFIAEQHAPSCRWRHEVRSCRRAVRTWRRRSVRLAGLQKKQTLSTFLCHEK